MGAWGDGPFESDGGLDEVFALLNHLIDKVEQLTCGPYPRGASVIRDEQALAANVELLCLVARAGYRPAMFVPIRGMPLPDPEVIDEWRDRFLARYALLAKRQLEGTPAELERFGREAAAPLVRLAKLSRQQARRSEATHRQVVAEVVAARRREAEEEGKHVQTRRGT